MHIGRVAAAAVLMVMAWQGAAAQPAAQDVAARVALLEANVAAGEDLSAVKRLQRTYGYFLDKGLWTDLAEYFTDDAVANYPAGIFVGKESIRAHLYCNVGGVQMGQVGLGDNRLYNHMNIQPVVHLDPGGRTAKGRWRAFAYFGSFGGTGTWAEGVYEMQYRKDNGVWKISKLDYYSGFGAPYATGWLAPAPPPIAAGADGRVQAPVPPPRPRRTLAHPADREREDTCDGFTAGCIAPFHYANPGTPAGGHAWIVAAGTTARQGSVAARVASASQRAGLLADEQQIENLQRIYGYYYDRRQWDQLTDLFAADGSIELGRQGVYVGKPRVRQFLDLLGAQGLTTGQFNDRIQLQTVVDVAKDGRTARARSREFSMTGVYEKSGQWSEGIYENAYVKQDGVWKFQSVHFFPTFITDYDKGWAQDAQPGATVSSTLPPDRPPSQVYAIFPKAHVPPYHYRNPVNGAVPTYPAVGGPDAKLARASLFNAGRLPAAPRVADPSAALQMAEQRIGRVKDFHELENLESAYGYYLDKNLWTDQADLFAKNGSMELAQRGVYSGDRLRGFLVQVFGRGQEGPVQGRLGNHVQMQPVIHVAEDGQTAKIRLRMMQQMSQGGRASMGGAIYENQAVKEDGIWKFSAVHAYNTFTANYLGGWAKGATRGMPGPSADYAPDAPPTAFIAMFPIVYDIPYHYANPVSGRTELPAVPSMASQLAAHPLPAPPPARAPVTGGIPADIAAALREIGPRIEAAKTTALYAPLQPKEPYANVSLARDQAYGPHERHRLDVFTATDKGKGRPIVVFVHGGGFSRGAKNSPGSPFYDNVGVWAATHGLVGVTLNYRLAPAFPFPAGVEDLRRAVAWLRSHAAEYGGDPKQIFLWGHSAGGAHVADYIVRTSRPQVKGAILTSGIYALGDQPSIWKDYYGEDVSKYRAKESFAGLLKTSVPLLVTYAELDPPNFVADSQALIKAREAAGRPVEHLQLAGHSHISETYAVGSGDETLTRPVLDFIQRTAGKR